MKKIYLFFLSTLCMSQTTNIDYTYNYLDDKTLPVYNFWKQYVEYRADNNLSYSKMWRDNDEDILITASGFNPNFYEMYTSNKLLYVKTLPNNKFEVASMFYWIQDENNVNLISIVKYIVAKIDDEYRFENYLTYSTNNWNKKEVGLIKYYYPDNYTFNIKNANKANKAIIRLNKLFDLKDERIDYYIAENCDKQLNIIGLDYIATTGLMDQCGYFDKHKNILLSTSFAGEDYRHEIIHLLNKKYPTSHYLILTGLSVYHDADNANLGKSTKDIFKIFNDYTQKNVDKKFEFTNSFQKINNEVGMEYIIGCILTDAILERGGIELLKTALNTVNTNEELNKFVKDRLNIIDQDNFIRKKSKEIESKNFKFKLEL